MKAKTRNIISTVSLIIFQLSFIALAVVSGYSIAGVVDGSVVVGMIMIWFVSLMVAVETNPPANDVF
jgi:hypothetical protein